MCNTSYFRWSIVCINQIATDMKTAKDAVIQKDVCVCVCACMSERVCCCICFSSYNLTSACLAGTVMMVVSTGWLLGNNYLTVLCLHWITRWAMCVHVCVCTCVHRNWNIQQHRILATVSSFRAENTQEQNHCGIISPALFLNLSCKLILNFYFNIVFTELQICV